jgi:non-ribosomal peptide synthase protein (TIGR01720 family)
LIVIHHLVVDGVSWRILLEDFALGCRQAENNEPISFQPKTGSFKHWARQLKKYALSKKLTDEFQYWKEIEQTQWHPLPRDINIEKEKKKIKNSTTLSMNLDKNQTRELLKNVNHVYNTEINDILLTGLGLALKDWAGLEKTVISLEGHGRQEIFPGINISRTVGWFTVEFPVILDMKGSRDLVQQIKQVKETLRKVPDKGIGYGIIRYLTPGDKIQGTRFNLEPEISFNYMGEFGQENDFNEDIFKMSRISVGDSIHPERNSEFALDIDALVVEEKLTVSFEYNRCEFRRTHIERLAELYRSNLIEIIRHCSTREKQELTASDYSAADLDQEELEDIFEGFE